MTDNPDDQKTPAPESDNSASAPAGDKADTPMIPKSRLDEEVGKRRKLEESVEAVADKLLGTVPEKLKGLVPEGLSATDRIVWFLNARETGVFDSKPKVPDTDQDTGKPKTTPKDRDLSDLPVHARIAAGYGKKD